jgi:hypothetical protein
VGGGGDVTRMGRKEEEERRGEAGYVTRGRRDRRSILQGEANKLLMDVKLVMASMVSTTMLNDGLKRAGNGVKPGIRLHYPHLFYLFFFFFLFVSFFYVCMQMNVKRTSNKQN